MFIIGFIARTFTKRSSRIWKLFAGVVTTTATGAGTNSSGWTRCAIVSTNCDRSGIVITGAIAGDHNMQGIGFENGSRVKVIEDHLEKHTTIGCCEACGKTVDLKCSKCGSIKVAVQDQTPPLPVSVGERFRQLILMAHDYRNSKFYLGCLLIATGDPAAAGKTMTDFAKQWGVGRAAVSKLCCWICNYLGIDPSPYMKSKSARESFRKSNRRPIKRK